MSKFAWVTLTTNDTYSLGALVLAHSLKRASTAHQLAVLVTPGVSEAMRNRLKEVYNIVQEVNVLDSQDAANLALLARPELGITFTKLHCWKLVQFEKCVFLDADILVLQNSDELFEREELSAAPDISWPDCFNSGVFVFRPNLETYSNLTKFAVEQGSFDGGDQGLLNQYFSDWSHKDINKHLPFIYNTHAFASYSYLPAFKQFRDRVKILHFAGRFKPWLANFNSESKTSYAPQEFQHIADLIQLWWNIYCASVHPSLSDEMAGLAGALSKLILGEARTPEQEAYEQHIRRQCWESGNIDYCGRDSFENIWKKITQTLEAGSPKTEQTTEPTPQTTTETTTEPTPQPQPERLTSADIEDGKVEFDPATNSTVTYRKIPKGYEVYIQTPQPNGTMKTQTKTFYDPVPVTAEELEREEALKKTTTTTTQKDSKKVTDKTVALSNPNTTVVVRKIPNGREEIYTTVNTDGTKSIQIKTFYDAEEEEITETTEVQQEMPGETRIITKQKTPNAPQQQRKVVQEKTENQQQLVETNKRSNLRRVNTEERSTEEVKYRSEKTVEETRKVSQTTEISGKSITTKKSNIEEQSHHAITDQREKKKKTRKAPPPPIEDKPGEKTTVKEKQIKGGTEYHYSTQLEDGRTVTSVKTVYEEESTEMSAEEIKKYKKHLKEAEKHKNVTKTTNVPSKVGTKQIVPGENPGDVTTVETIKIEGGTEYRYTTVTAEGLVKKSSRTVYDPTPVEGDSEEEEIIEEYEEEIIEPGESVTETFTSTKILPPKGGHVEVPAQKKKGKKSKN